MGYADNNEFEFFGPRASTPVCSQLADFGLTRP
jgi:hypothetical protein